MLYSYLFLILTGYSLFTFFQSEEIWVRLILVALSLNFSFLGVIYLLKRPVLFGKQRDGRLKVIPMILNSLWRSFSLMLLKLTTLSKEPKYNRLRNHSFYIGRKLSLNEYPKDIQVIIDLTSEFSEVYPVEVEYISFPMLDGVSPKRDIRSDLKSMLNNIRDKNVYIHCAQGHGRTALFTSILLSILEGRNAIDCYKDIIEVRPLAKMSSDQKTYLQKII